MVNDLGPMLLGIQWSLWILSTGVVSARVYIRSAYLKSRLNLADWTMVIALFCETLAACFTTVAVHHGLGRHIATLTPHQRIHAILWEYILSVFNLFAPMFGRLSFTIFLLGILPPQAKLQKISLHIVNFVQISSVCITQIQLFAQCGSDVSALWDPRIDWASHCQPHSVALYIGYITASLYAVCDLWLTVLPILITRKLNMQKSLKLALIAVLCLSGLAFLGSVTRVTLLTFLARPDLTWYITYLVMCVIIESNIVIICASMPVLRVLWKRDGRSRSTNRVGTGGDDSYDLSHGSKIPAPNISHRVARHLGAPISKLSARRDPTSDGTSEDYILENENDNRDMSASASASAAAKMGTQLYPTSHGVVDTLITPGRSDTGARLAPTRDSGGSTSPTGGGPQRPADISKTTRVQITYGRSSVASSSFSPDAARQVRSSSKDWT